MSNDIPSVPEDNFRQRVLMSIHAIPYGKVATYGQIARLAGSSRAARQVGGILRKLPKGSSIPWYRVVNRSGNISLIGPDYTRQRTALQDEGITFNASGVIDLALYGWDPSQP
ncbi:MGMT family protein [Hafnia alvei]|jgi:methylated-DNA-protein-cysteine methyltransferase-like protein|uniref:MGMT family protein n=1 Tax=Hafnia alvei TaxID=569 RepID=UPI000E05C4D3|nr:MGMT family protein [Hafnia alvei]QBJ34192.1 MGMT family protein [Hafnia alvei]TBM17513.1 MGMT family protein [Hafnia alvei]STQ68127.1 Methylated-DNA--protein-cysteine methyltransferase [Hafnia alvei]